MPALIPADPSQLPELGRTFGGGWFRFSTEGEDRAGQQARLKVRAAERAIRSPTTSRFRPNALRAHVHAPSANRKSATRASFDGDELEQFIHAWVNQEMAIRGLLKRQGNVIRIGDD